MNPQDLKILSDSLHKQQETSETMTTNEPENDFSERLPNTNTTKTDKERIQDLENINTKYQNIPTDLNTIKIKVEHILQLFQEGKMPVHACIQTHHIEELKKELHQDRASFYKELNSHNDRTYEAFKRIEKDTTEIKTRLQYKKEKDQERNGYLREDSQEIVELKVRTTAVETDMNSIKLYQKIIMIAIVGMLITLIGFIIEFQYKTFYLHI